MKRRLFIALLIMGTLASGQGASAYTQENENNIHDYIVDIFKDIEAIFSWHVDDRKTLKEVGEDLGQGILA